MSLARKRVRDSRKSNRGPGPYTVQHCSDTSRLPDIWHHALPWLSSSPHPIGQAGAALQRRRVAAKRKLLLSNSFWAVGSSAGAGSFLPLQELTKGSEGMGNGGQVEKGLEKHQRVLHNSKLLWSYTVLCHCCITTDGGLAKPLHKLLQVLRRGLRVLALFSVIFCVVSVDYDRNCVLVSHCHWRVMR